MGTLTYSLGLGIRGTRIWGSKGRHLFHDHDQGGLEGAEGSGTFAPFYKQLNDFLYSIDTLGWKPGLYLIRAIIDNEALSGKVMVK